MKLFNQILNASRIHKEGFTMDLEGNVLELESGYCVGIQPAEFTELEQPRERFLGGWTDEKTGVFYLDWVRIIEDKGDAVRTAKKFKQLAIYDFENKEVVYI